MTDYPRTLAERLARMPINKWPASPPPSVATRSRCEEFEPLPCVEDAVNERIMSLAEMFEARAANGGIGKTNEQLDKEVEAILAKEKARHQAHWVTRELEPVTIEPVNDDSDPDLVWNVTRGVGVTLKVDKDSPHVLTIYAGYCGDECLDVDEVETLAERLTDIAAWMRANQ